MELERIRRPNPRTRMRTISKMGRTSSNASNSIKATAIWADLEMKDFPKDSGPPLCDPRRSIGLLWTPSSATLLGSLSSWMIYADIMYIFVLSLYDIWCVLGRSSGKRLPSTLTALCAPVVRCWQVWAGVQLTPWLNEVRW